MSILLSYIIVTRNRRGLLLRTLEHLHRNTSLPREDWEVCLVDNGSSDGTAQAVRQQYPRVRQINHKTNQGACARTDALADAQGKYLVFLDDDSYPLGNAVAQAIHYLDEHPQAASVTGRVLLPDGSLEASALPAVPIGCAMCIRKSVLEQVGGFPRSFNRQAEEYDLAFRVLDAGYAMPRFEDVTFRHEKPPGGRPTPTVHRLDLRNNLVVANRYLPAKLRRIYQQDWLNRYTAIAKHAGFSTTARRGLWEARAWRAWGKFRPRKTVSQATLEAVLGLSHQAKAVADWAKQERVRNVVIADYSKNLYATHRACLESGLTIQAIADSHHAFAGMRYRGIRIKEDPYAIDASTDGIVLSNVNPAQIDQRIIELKHRFNGPILRLWHPSYIGDPQESHCPDPAPKNPQPTQDLAAA